MCHKRDLDEDPGIRHAPGEPCVSQSLEQQLCPVHERRGNSGPRRGTGRWGGAYFSAATVLRWDIQQNFPAYGEDLLVGFVALKSG